MQTRGLAWFVAALALARLGSAQDLATFEKSLTEHQLENGMRFLFVERHEVPVVSFHLYADVGSVDE
ncbi:MAG: hypothetical protein ACRD3V_21895, partial [Vicinamibacteria bacterium]